MMFKIDVQAFKKQIQQIEEKLPQVVSNGLQELAEQGAQEAKLQTKGELAAHTAAYRNSAFEQGIKADKNYASWVEYGNGPPGTRIYPTSAKALHFFIDGQEVFAKSVQASRPKPFMASAVSFVNRSGAQIVANHIDRFLKGS